MLIRKIFACTAIASLDFIEHQQPIIIMADLGELFQIVVCWRVQSAFALDWLNQHGTDIRISAVCCHGSSITKRHPDKILI